MQIGGQRIRDSSLLVVNGSAANRAELSDKQNRHAQNGDASDDRHLQLLHCTTQLHRHVREKLRRVRLQESLRMKQVPDMCLRRHLQLPTVVRHLLRLLFRVYLHSSRRSGVSSCWTTAVHQLSVKPTTV